MKLLTYDTGAGPRCGVLHEDEVVDVSSLVGDGRLLPDVRALLEFGDSPSTGCVTLWRTILRRPECPWRM